MVSGTGDFPGAGQTGIDVNDYDALRDYLKKQTLPELVLTFEEIEAIIDACERCAIACGCTPISAGATCTPFMNRRTARIRRCSPIAPGKS